MFSQWFQKGPYFWTFLVQKQRGLKECYNTPKIKQSNWVNFKYTPQLSKLQGVLCFSDFLWCLINTSLSSLVAFVKTAHYFWELLRAAAIFSSEELPKNCTCCVAVLCKQARGLLLPSVMPAAEFHFMKIQTCPLLAVIDEHNFQDTIEDLFSFINRDDEQTHIWKVVEKKQSDLHNT